MKLAKLDISGRLLTALGALTVIALLGVAFVASMLPPGELGAQSACAALGAVLAAAFASAFLALRASVATPLYRLAEALESGNGGQAPPGLTRPDEAGRIARAWMAEREARDAEDQRIGEQRRRDIETEARDQRERDERRKAESMSALDEALRSIAAGDLGIRLGNVSEWGARFDPAVTLLDKAMRAFAACAAAIGAKSREISAASEERSLLDERRGAGLAPASERLAKWGAEGSTLGEGAKHARETLRGLGAEAAGRARAIRSSLEAFDAVVASTRQVAEFTGLVDEIAFQTKLLAFNAAVEAARAGEAGRGIAVIAEEMRALSRRSTQAAKELTAKVALSSAEARDGAERMRAAAASLDRIYESAAGLDEFAARVESEASALAADAPRIGRAITRAFGGDGEAMETVAAASSSIELLIEKASILLQHFGLASPEPAGESAPPAPPARLPPPPLRSPRTAAQSNKS